jgi:hypothetical protein
VVSTFGPGKVLCIGFLQSSSLWQVKVTTLAKSAFAFDKSAIVLATSRKIDWMFRPSRIDLVEHDKIRRYQSF